MTDFKYVVIKQSPLPALLFCENLWNKQVHVLIDWEIFIAGQIFAFWDLKVRFQGNKCCFCTTSMY